MPVVSVVEFFAGKIGRDAGEYKGRGGGKALCSGDKP